MDDTSTPAAGATHACTCRVTVSSGASSGSRPVVQAPAAMITDDARSDPSSVSTVTPRRVLSEVAHARADPELGPARVGDAERRHHRRFGAHDAGVRFERSDRVVSSRKPRKPPAQCRRVERLDG